MANFSWTIGDDNNVFVVIGILFPLATSLALIAFKAY